MNMYNHVSVKRPTMGKVLNLILWCRGSMLQPFLLTLHHYMLIEGGKEEEADMETEGRLMEGATCAVDCHISTYP